MSINIHDPSGLRFGCLALSVFVLPFRVMAQPAAGGPYGLSAESLNSSGGASASGSYGHHAAVGEVSGVAGLSGSAAIKAGSVAQLYEPTGLVLSAASTEVEEEETLTIQPFLVLDDTSLLAISPGVLAWSPVTGPVVVSSSGVVTGQAVASDTPATISATGLTFSATLDLMVKNTLTDNFGSYAGDGLADDWQVLHFGEDNPLAAPEVDADGDGQDNRFEFTAGLLPNDPTSRFLIRIESVPGVPEQKRVVFSPVLPDRTYTLIGSVNLDGITEWLPVGPIATSTTGQERTVTDLEADEPSMFYRIEIIRP